MGDVFDCVTYRKFNATPPSRGRHQRCAGLVAAALAGCLSVGHPAPVFAQEAQEVATARIGINLLRAFGVGQPGDVIPSEEAPQRDAGAAPAAEAPPGAIRYRVAPGDTLASIASRIEGASVDWRGLCSINEGRIADCNAIEVGDVIVIPDGASIRDASATPRADNDASAPSPRLVAASLIPSPRPALAASSPGGVAPTVGAGRDASAPSPAALAVGDTGGVSVAGLADLTEQSPAWQNLDALPGLVVRLRAAPAEADGQGATPSAAEVSDGAGAQAPDARPQGDAAIEAGAPRDVALSLLAPAPLPVAAPSAGDAMAATSGDDTQADAAEVAGADAVAESDAPPAEATRVAAAQPLPNDADGNTATGEQDTPDAQEAPQGPRVIAELRYGAGSLPMALRSYHMHRIEELGGAVRVSGHVAGLYSTGTTGGAFLRLEEGFEARAAGQTVRVSVTMSGPAGGVAALAYSTNDLGNSGWRSFALTPEPVAHSFDYTLPPLVHGNGDFIGIDPDPEGAGHSVVIHDILVEILGGNPA